MVMPSRLEFLSDDRLPCCCGFRLEIWGLIEGRQVCSQQSLEVLEEVFEPEVKFVAIDDSVMFIGR